MLERIKNIPLYFSLLCLLSLLLILPEVSGNPNTMLKYFQVSTSLVLMLTAIFGIFLKLKGIDPILPKFYRFILFIFTFTFLLSLSLSIISFATTPNYVYSKFHLNFDKLFFISIFSFVLLLLSQRNEFFKRNYKLLIFYSGPVLLFIFSVIALWPFDIFLQLIKEDNIVEYLQFLTLLFGGIFASLLTHHFLKDKKRILAFIFIFVTLGLFATAGDEISWGQRLLSLTTPEVISEYNLQNETGFHNTIYIDDLVPFIYLLVGLYGGFIHFARKLLARKISKDLLRYFIPPPYLTFFFFIPFIYNFYTLGWEHYIGRWSEIAELYLYLGVTIFLAESYYRSRK